MRLPVFRFDEFRLDTQARELFRAGERIVLPISTLDCLAYLIRHRDRPVGRDELASAVWGRVDVSEVSISHAIMRLRRLLGDTGNEQRVIRTVPRIGYRWVLDSVIEDAAGTDAGERLTPPPPLATAALVDESTAATSAEHGFAPTTANDAAPPALPATPPTLVSAAEAALPLPIAKPRASGRRSIFVVAIIALVLAAVASWLVSRRADDPVPSVAAELAPALVLPASIDAPPGWDWLRLGVMDMVADQLRRGELATMSSEAVVALVNASRRSQTVLTSTGWLLRPSVSQAGKQWTVRLDASRDGRRLDIEAQADDPIRAGRAAADELLIKLGHTPPDDSGVAAEPALDTLRRRVNAAVLAGQVEVARSVIEAAPASLQASPEIALSRAKVDFFAGRYDACRANVEALLRELPADASRSLRARALSTLGAALFRQGELDAAGRAYTQAIEQFDPAQEPSGTAKAWLGVAGIASQRLQLDAAAADYGRARNLFDRGNDAHGIAAVELNLGMNALQRGQPAAALQQLDSAANRFQRLASEDGYAATVLARVDTYRRLLDHPQALAESERFGIDQGRAANPRQRWELALARAAALVDLGRLSDAETVLDRLSDGSSAQEDRVVRIEAQALGARIALLRGANAQAAALARAALQPALLERSRQDYAANWRVLVEALGRNGDHAAAATAANDLLAWSDGTVDAPGRIDALLAVAGQGADSSVRLAGFADAMQQATRRGVPEELVSVAAAYVPALIAAGRSDDAAAVAGQVATWAGRDFRVAVIDAQLQAALGDFDRAAAARQQALRLAGEIPLAGAASAGTIRP